MEMLKAVRTGIRWIFIAPILLYRTVVSPLIPSRCIYTPSCSSYTIEAIKKHGILKGLLAGFFRIGRCHSMFTGGEDPVPDAIDWKTIKTGYIQFRDRGRH